MQRIDYKLSDLSVRHFLGVQKDFSVLSLDGKSMDLAMMAELGDIKAWKEIFSWGADNHFEMLRVGNPDLFKEIFRQWGGEGIGRIHKLKANDQVFFLVVADDFNNLQEISLSNEQYRKLANFRSIAKETNLAIPYMLGANQLAQKIAAAIGEEVHEDFAKEILDSYHKNFPEIRRFQDRVANDLYLNGFIRASHMGSEFGIRLHSNCYYRLNSSLGKDNEFEFVLKMDGHHFYVSTSGWVKHKSLVEENLLDNPDVIESLKYTFVEFGLFFERINFVVRLPDEIFKQKLLKAAKTRYRKKNEDDLEESSNYVHSSAERSCMIDRYLRSNLQASPSSIEHATANMLLRYDYGFIPESSILFHRVSEGKKQSYFKTFRSLASEIKKIFPTFIQSVSAACVARVLSQVRIDIEDKQLKSYIFLSVHDSIDIMVHKDEEVLLKEMTEPLRLRESFIPILWERAELATHYS